MSKRPTKRWICASPYKNTWRLDPAKAKNYCSVRGFGHRRCKWLMFGRPLPDEMEGFRRERGYRPNKKEDQ